MVELVPTLLRQELARLAEDDLRLDGRGRWEGLGWRQTTARPLWRRHGRCGRCTSGRGAIAL